MAGAGQGHRWWWSDTNELMVFCFFLDKKIYHLLLDFRERGLPEILRPGEQGNFPAPIFRRNGSLKGAKHRPAKNQRFLISLKHEATASVKVYVSLLHCYIDRTNGAASFVRGFLATFFPQKS